MKIDLFDIDQFVKLNSCPQVTNPVFFNFDGNPTSDGLFSYDLFGMSDTERKNTFGYIDLKGHFIHPLIYSMMKGRMGSLRDILSGDKYAVIINKKIVIVPEDFEGASTGLSFLYDNFEKIDWLDEVEEEETDSIDKKTRLKFLKSVKKNEFFVTKWLVLPPFYRGESSESQTMGDTINSLYKDLISRTNSLGAGFGIQMFGDATRLRIQNTLLELFTETTRPVKGKNSLLRKHLLGKTIDYTASNVITSPEISKANRPKDMPVRFGYGSFPIATVISLFTPFYVNAITEFLGEMLRFMYMLHGDDIKKINLNQFNTEFAEKLVKLYIKSEGERSNTMSFKYTNNEGKTAEKEIKIYEYRGKSELTQGKFIERGFTYTDLFFIISQHQIVPDKHIYVTRYPVINFQNIYPSKISLQTTVKTRPELFLKFNPETEEYLEFKDYPFIKFQGDPKPAPDAHYEFINVLVPGNVYIKALGGDYDGDMLYMRGVFTKEANAEASKIIYSKANFLDASGGPARGLNAIGKEASIALFELTKDGK
jgi:hypothetical protein